MQLKVITDNIPLRFRIRRILPRIIAEKTSDKGQALGVCSSLNY